MKKITIFVLSYIVIIMLSACQQKDFTKKTLESISLTIDDISQYSLVYPKKDAYAELFASWVADHIEEKCDITMNVISDDREAVGKEILIGNTNRTDSSYTTQTLNWGTYLIGVDEMYICTRGSDALSCYYAVKHLLTMIDECSEGNQQMTIDSVVEEIPVVDTLKSMSFNIQTRLDSETRGMLIIKNILNELPDTIGVQEASEDWMDFLEKYLGEIYSYEGIGRDGGRKDEHCAIFYRKDRFELQDSDTKWLSDTPDKVSKFEESNYMRIMTYALLLDKQSNNEIMVINTHLDNKQGTARLKQTKVLMNLITDMNYHIVLTGDFNSSAYSDIGKLIKESLSDSKQIAQNAEEGKTFIGGGVIDHIFVSQQSFDVMKYRVNTSAKGSDHYPVIIEYTFK